jgi:sortase A
MKSVKAKLYTVSKRVALVLALIILIYPVAANWFSAQRGTKTVSAYRAQVKKLHDTEIQAMFAQAKRYNANVRAAQNGDASVMTEHPNYNDVFNLGKNGIMAYLEVPQLDIYDMPIYHGTSERVLARGLGHLEGTSVPTGAGVERAVITGHAGRRPERLLTELDSLQVGDVFYVNVLDKRFKYRIFAKEIILPADVGKVKIKRAQNEVSLITCTPLGINTHRLVVTGKRVATSDVRASEHKTRNWLSYDRLVTAGMVLLVMVIVSRRIIHVIKRNRRAKL